MDTFDVGQPLICGTTVAEVLDANNEDIKTFIKQFKNEYRKQWQSTASAILKSAGISGNVVDILQIKDVCNIGDCVSPVRKKQKSNDFDKSNNGLATIAPTATEPKKVNHGLPEEELMRIHKLKRVDLMKEIEKLGGEYHKTWTKGELVHSLLTTHANKFLPDTQQTNDLRVQNAMVEIQCAIEQDDLTLKSTVKKPTTAFQKQNCYSDVEVIDLAHKSTAITSIFDKDVPYHNTPEVARSIADAVENENIESIASPIEQVTSKSLFQKVDDIMKGSSLVQPPKKVVAANFEGLSNMHVDQSSAIHELLPLRSTDTDMDDENEIEDVFESAKENFSQSQTSPYKQLVVAKYSTPCLSPIPDSAVKPTRSSPSVPVGIVDSAKKQLLSSQKKEQTLKIPSKTRSAIAQKLDLEQKPGKIYFDKSRTNLLSAMPAADIGNVSLNANSGFSEKVKASAEARSGMIAQVKAKSKMTCQKPFPPTSTLGNSGTKLIKPQYKTLPYAKFDPKARFAQIRAIHENQKNIDQIEKPWPIDEVQSGCLEPTFPQMCKDTFLESNPPLTKPLEEDFLSYEMTDGEYDSDDDDSSEARKSKRIPEWARTANLAKALEIQYSKDYLIDPDELFGEVETCNLEAIFGLPLPKFRRRNSSGDWTKHRVTSEEKRKYKRYVANSKEYR